MGLALGSCIALVTQPTRLEGLLGRWSTKSAAKFRFKGFRAHERMQREQQNVVANEALSLVDEEADFMLYEEEDQNYKEVVDRLRDELDFGLPVVEVPKNHISNFLFLQAMLVVVVGKDGLVANTAKYTDQLPIIGVNPDPERIDGVLLPYTVNQVRSTVRKVLDGRFQTKDVTLAQTETNDGQKLLAFNDLFIGQAGHQSARYTLRCGQEAEPQSSSGVIVSTGAGATGWMSSVLNMAQSIARSCGANVARPKIPDWDDRELTWAVREPFISKHSSANLVFGKVAKGEELVVESLMPENGVVFSDGIASDFLEFNSGTIVRVRVAKERAKLVIPQAWSNR